jgi:hypothetical protein
LVPIAESICILAATADAFALLDTSEIWKQQQPVNCSDAAKAIASVQFAHGGEEKGENYRPALTQKRGDERRA